MMNLRSVTRVRGVSLIELMIALAIGSLLVLGLVEVFSASRTAYQLSEGLARVQENGRFAMDYIQRDFRMAGHMGCVNDQSRFLPENAAGTRSALASTFLLPADQAAENYAAASSYALRFDVPMEGYEFTNTGPGTTLTLAAAPALNTNPAAWTPTLPTALSNALGNRIGGSDILVLRQFSPRGAQVTSFLPGDPATITVAAGQWDNLLEGDPNPRLFGIADCMSAGVFFGTTVASPTITVATDPSNNKSGLLGNEPFIAGQAYVYKAETLVYYVGLNGAGNPALFRLRVDLDNNGQPVDGPTAREELVEGIESMQLRYGIDSQPGVTQRPTGNIGTSEEAGAATPWRRVGLVQIGLVARSLDAAAAEQRAGAATRLSALGVTIAPPDDTRYRAVYESSIALRNRLFGH